MNFKDSFTYFTDLINSSANFALARYGDGEIALMENEGIPFQTQAFNQDRWHAPAQATKLGEGLIDSLKHKEDNYYYGIPGKNDSEVAYEYLTSLIPNDNITYANLFVNANYEQTKDFFKSLKKSITLIANKSGNPDLLPFSVDVFCSFPDDCVNWWEKEGDEFIEMLRNYVATTSNETFFLSIGPAAEVAIHEMYKANPNNQYIDVGSAIDEWFYGKQTRPYMDSNSTYASHISSFD
jgi:hypothetical protein